MLLRLRTLVVAVELPDRDVRLIACGRDPHFPLLTDVAQLNYVNPDMRLAMIQQLTAVARHADGVRCDMAMLPCERAQARLVARGFCCAMRARL